MSSAAEERGIIGLLAEFDTATELLGGVRVMKRHWPAEQLEVFSPFPVEGIDEELQRPPSRLPLAMFAGGLAGAVGGYSMMYYALVIDYPINVGGRPLHSWPAFVPVTFELTVLGAAVVGFIGVLVASRLPRLHHPVFNAPRFRAASQRSFFLLLKCAEGADARERLRRQLEPLHPRSLTELYA